MTVDKKIGFHGIGPGGFRCVCCAPSPGKNRRAHFRRARKRIKREWKNDVATTLAAFDITK